VPPRSASSHRALRGRLPLVRNPSTPAIGLTTLNKHWLLGGHENAGKVDQVLNGWLGDVRIVNRPLRVGEFMNA
jgi:hypothetical protein